MPYEEMTGETYPMTLDNDDSLSGSSTDWEGADDASKSVTVRWTWPSGIINIGWDALSTGLQSSITDIANDSASSTTDRISRINQAIYNYVSYLMEPGGESYDDFADKFVGTNCIVINR